MSAPVSPLLYHLLVSLPKTRTSVRAATVGGKQEAPFNRWHTEKYMRMSPDHRFLTQGAFCPTIIQAMTLTVRSANLVRPFWPTENPQSSLKSGFLSLLAAFPLHKSLAPESFWSIRRILQELMAEGAEEVSPGVSS